MSIPGQLSTIDSGLTPLGQPPESTGSNGLFYDSPNVFNGHRLLRSLKEGIAPCVFFDPQYRGLLDQMDYGNEGERQSERSALPQMSTELIHKMLQEIARVLRPSRYCFQWIDKHALCEGLYRIPGLKIVDLLTWEKPRIGMGYRTRRKAEYLRVLQKPPTEAKSTWTDHGIPDVWAERPGGDHPHAKPLELQRSLIASVTQPGEFIIDPCAGGYGVMRAAHATGRRFLGCDLLPYPQPETVAV